MNERIRKLAIDAGGRGLKMSTVGLSLLGEDQIGKFAELIIRECICQCDNENSQQYIMVHFGMKLSDWS